MGFLPQGTQLFPTGVNDDDVVVGYGSTGPFAFQGQQATHALIWQNGTLTDISHSITGNCAYCFSYAADINDSNQVVGWAYNGSGNKFGWMYQNGTVTNLGVNFEPAAISSSGEVVGYLNVDGGVNVNAAIYDNGTVTDLDSVDADSAATGVNASGDVVGSSQPIANGSVEPIEWLPDGTAINLGQLPGFPDSEATGINDSGTIVGTSSGGPNGAETAFVDTDGTGLTQLGDSDSTTAVAINDAGDVVGEDIYGETPVVWSNGVETDTPLLDGAEDGFATGINSNGAVVGYGDMGPNGQTDDGFLWSAP